MEEEKDNGCEEGFNPYKFKYRIENEGKETVCIKKGEDPMDALRNSLAMNAWNLGDFEVIILEKKPVEHIDY